MWYWIVVILLILGCAALLGGTFMTIKKNKAEDAMMRRTGGHRRVSPDEEDDEEDAYQYERRRRRSRREEEAPRARQRKRRQWKIILEDLDSWEKYSFIFSDTVPTDVRVSKNHCMIIHRGDKLYLKDEGSRNGTFLNGKRVDRPIVIQKDDVIGVGETRLEILKILRESE